MDKLSILHNRSHTCDTGLGREIDVGAGSERVDSFISRDKREREQKFESSRKSVFALGIERLLDIVLGVCTTTDVYYFLFFPFRKLCQPR